MESQGTDTHRPVVIDVAEFVGQPLDVVRLQATAVIDDIIVCWGHTPTSHSLAHDEEVIPAKTVCHAWLFLGADVGTPDSSVERSWALRQPKSPLDPACARKPGLLLV